MADLTITAANVAYTSGGSTKTAIAGEAITAGEAVYIDTSDSNKIKLANVTSATASVVAGVSVNDAASGQHITYVTAGAIINPGATVAVGKLYVCSASGAIAPVDDLTTSDYVSVIYVGTAASSVTLLLENTGVLHA